MMTDDGWGSGVVGGVFVIAVVKYAKDSRRCASDL